MAEKINIFWMRRDIRLHDNHALYKALNAELPVLILFIFDTDILDELPDDDARLNIIHQELKKLNRKLKRHNSAVLVRHGKPDDVFDAILNEFDVNAVYFNEDYEPYAVQRDQTVKRRLGKQNVQCYSFTDQVVASPDSILKDDGTAYRVFTPYMKAWRKHFKLQDIPDYPSEKYLENLAKSDAAFPDLESMGYTTQPVKLPDHNWTEKTVQQYEDTRDIPAENGTSRLSVHLRFGFVSIRRIYRKSWNLSDVFVNELIWREFYMMILYHFPDVVDKAFKPAYDNIRWRNNEAEFKRWCSGETGFPIVDAGMRQLNETGYMHNRLRMITASFLVKDLLIDWRWGEAYFAKKLLDYDLAANNGGWQWAAGSGCDAAPYFRIFNPYSQQKKFDPDMAYIRRWVPEIDSADYPEPMLDHKAARIRALDVYKEGLG